MTPTNNDKKLNMMMWIVGILFADTGYGIELI